MPRQGGQGKGKPKLAERHFGVSLIRSKKQIIHKKDEPVLVSILEHSSLDDYILSAEMDGKEAEVIKSNNDIELIQPIVLKTVQSMTMDNYSQHQLSIPRKPHWTKEMTREQLDRLETDSFLQWRRELAAAEASLTGMKLTPFEKNINVWRQLWRVIERSDIVIQVVDARNPLFYFSADLGQYVADLSTPKPLILLVNKADFLSKYQR
jgi:large subunit GTPase 1